MRVIDLALKDVLQVIRDRKALIFLAIMPIAFTFFMGLIFGSSGNSAGKLRVGILDMDQGRVLSETLHALLAGADAIAPVPLAGAKAATAPEAVRDDKLAAVVSVPSEFSRKVLAGMDVPLTVIADSSRPVGQAAIQALRTVTARLLNMVRLAQLSAESSAALKPFESDAARQAYIEQTFLLARQGWEQPPITIQVEQPGAARTDKPSQVSSAYVQASPGMIVQFSIYGLMMAGTVLVLERKTGTLRRLLTTPITRAEIIAGKLLAMFLIVLLQETLLVGFGQFAFGVNYLREPLATFVMMVTLALWTASMGLYIGAISKGEEQVIMWTLLAMFVLAAMGGAWFPLDVTGKTFSTLGHLLPSAWAMDGFQNIILRRLGFSSVLLPAAILLAYAGVFFVLAVWRFGRE